MTSDTRRIAPIVRGPGEGDSYWFLGAYTTITASGDDTGGRVAVMDNLAPRGHGSPMHVHGREDEWFHVIEGELTFWIDGRVVVAPAGSFVYGPRGVPHTFLVSSDEARFVLTVQPAGFEDFLRAAGEPATSPDVPPAASGPPDPEALTRLAAGFGIEITGPPGIPA
jgi:quercetin dioxygenase-like cupin family protein